MVRNVWNSILGAGSIVWLSLTFLFSGVSAHAQSQEPPAAEAATATSAAQPQLDPQPPGTISGTVLDSTGAVVVGARVALTRADQSSSQEVLSGVYGQFSFSNVVPGAFQITITAAGFASQTSSGVLHPGETYFVPANTLPPAAVDTVVKVGASRIEIAVEQIRVQEKQRILGVVPNFYVSYVPDAVPLSARQKFQLAWKSNIDPVTFGLAGATAGVEQATGAFNAYGPGPEGYAKRLGAAYADSATSTLIGGAILPSLFKQDPRYFYKGTGSVPSRALYAIANSVICKGDNQHWQPNYSGILGGIASAGISNLYYPAQDRGVGLVFENTLVGTGTTAVVNLLQEFVVRRLTPHAGKSDPSQP